MTLVSEDHCPLRTGANAPAQDVALRAPAAASERSAVRVRHGRGAGRPFRLSWLHGTRRSTWTNACGPSTKMMSFRSKSSWLITPQPDGSAGPASARVSVIPRIAEPSKPGLARANNKGIRESHGEYVCLVNSDVVLSRGTLYALYEFMQSNPDVAIAGPQMRGPDGSVRRSSMRDPSLLNAFARAFAIDNLRFVSRRIGGQMMTDFSHREIADVDILNGWFWFIRRKALDEVGLLDERFFMYGEDMDWCYRFRKAGWRLVFNPAVSALHYGGGSSARRRSGSISRCTGPTCSTGSSTTAAQAGQSTAPLSFCITP